jgi:hypothetical protein
MRKSTGREMKKDREKQSNVCLRYPVRGGPVTQFCGVVV